MKRQFEDVTAQLSDSHVAVAELNRPPANYFDTELLTALGQALGWAADRGARAVVLCSAGKHFCAGMNFADAQADAEALYGAGLQLFKQPLPIVAAIQGQAIGGGAGLALAADFRVCEDASSFRFNFAALGLHHGFGLSYTLPRVVGPQRAAELLMTARRVEATEAMRLGLADRLCPAGQSRSSAVELASQIAAGAPLAVAAIRATLREGMVEEVAAAMCDEAPKQAALTETDDFREGIRAARQRRAPAFVGK